MSQESELAYLFRVLKAPAAARALPKLAERARQEQWSYERLVQTLLQTEVSARDSHGGEARIRQATVPCPQDAGGVRLQFPAVGEEDGDRASRPARLPALQGVDRGSWPARYRQDTLGDRALDPRVPRRPPRPVRDRHPMGRPPPRRQARRPARGRTRDTRPDPRPGDRTKSATSRSTRRPRT